MPTRLQITRYGLADLINALRLKHGVEVGVHHGYFSYYLLKHTRLESLWSVDMYTGKYAGLEEDARRQLSEFGERSCLIVKTSKEAAQIAGTSKRLFDFVYIDAGHRQRQVAEDLELWEPLLASGGILSGHDYIDAPKTGVIPAVNEYAAERGWPVFITREKWASWVIFKP